MNAIELLKSDHDKVKEMFSAYQKGREAAEEIFRELEIHSQLEEEIFYPAMRAADQELVEAGIDDHKNVEHMILRMRSGTKSDSLMTQLISEVLKHIGVEESQLFPKARSVLKDDLDRLGEQMKNRKEELVASGTGVATRAERASGGRVSREDLERGRMESEGGHSGTETGRAGTPPPP